MTTLLLINYPVSHLTRLCLLHNVLFTELAIIDTLRGRVVLFLFAFFF